MAEKLLTQGITFTQELLERMQDRVKGLGLSKSAYIRQLVMQDLNDPENFEVGTSSKKRIAEEGGEIAKVIIRLQSEFVGLLEAWKSDHQALEKLKSNVDDLRRVVVGMVEKGDASGEGKPSPKEQSILSGSKTRRAIQAASPDESPGPFPPATRIRPIQAASPDESPGPFPPATHIRPIQAE